jgi:ABC-type multidrug transport system fused ATPase/permease subunit
MSEPARRPRLYTYIADFKGLFLVGFGAMTLVTAGQLAGPLVIRSIIDTCIPKGDVSGMILRAVAYFGLVLAMGALTYFGSMTIARLGLEAVTRIKKDLFAHFLTLPVAYFDQHPVGELMSRTESDTERVRDLFSNIGISLAVNAFFFVGMLGVCFVLEPHVTVYIAVALPFALGFVIFFFDKLRVFYDRSRVLTAKVNARVTEFVQGVEVLKAFGRVPWAEATLDHDAGQKRDNDVKSSLIEYSAMAGLGFLIGPVFMAAVIFFLSPKILTGAMTLGTLFVFLDYGRKLFDPLMQIAENIRSIQQARVSVKRIFDILSLPPEDRSGRAPGAFESEVEFRHVWFRYKEAKDGEESWVLRDVSFTITKGRTLALVGPSGSGKTTVVALLCRFYEPQKGEILVDGLPLASLDLEAWRRKIGLVLQDVYLFPGSVLENVRVYDDRISAASVESALATVQAKDLVARLPGGLDAVIRERGGNISAGEKQLLSFARAVAFSPEIVVLDEATASIDVKTERKIKESMDRLLSGRTAVIVAHRLSSVLNADQILFFKDGRVAARGRHAELIGSFPEYAELVRLQLLASAPEREEADSAAVNGQGT